jgi:hypothetical protein
VEDGWDRVRAYAVRGRVLGVYTDSERAIRPHGAVLRSPAVARASPVVLQWRSEAPDEDIAQNGVVPRFTIRRPRGHRTVDTQALSPSASSVMKAMVVGGQARRPDQAER